MAADISSGGMRDLQTTKLCQHFPPPVVPPCAHLDPLTLAVSKLQSVRRRTGARSTRRRRTSRTQPFLSPALRFYPTQRVRMAPPIPLQNPATPSESYFKKRDWQRPTVLSRYSILGFLSSGTYGRVVCALSRSLNGRGANKALRSTRRAFESPLRMRLQRDSWAPRAQRPQASGSS